MDLSALAATARTTMVEQVAPSGDRIYWRVRRLSVAEVVRLAGPGILLPEEPPREPDEHDLAMAEVRKAEGTEPTVADQVARATAIARVAVDAVSDGSSEWVPVQLVETEENPTEGRLLDSTILPHVLADVVLAAMAGLVEGRDSIRPFRPGRIEPGPTGVGSLEAPRETE